MKLRGRRKVEREIREDKKESLKKRGETERERETGER